MNKALSVVSDWARSLGFIGGVTLVIAASNGAVGSTLGSFSFGAAGALLAAGTLAPSVADIRSANRTREAEKRASRTTKPASEPGPEHSDAREVDVRSEIAKAIDDGGETLRMPMPRKPDGWKPMSGPGSPHER